MNDSVLVRLLQRLHDLRGNFESLVDRNRSACDALRKRLSGNELENEVVNVARLLQAVDRGNVRMIERRQNFRLPPKSSQALFILGELIR